MKRLTKYQQGLLDYLRKGGYLRSNTCGWYDPRIKSGIRIRVETQDALEATGLVEEIKIQGKRIVSYRVIYKQPQAQGGGL